MKVIYGEPLDKPRERNHKIVRVKAYYGIQNISVVLDLVVVLVLLGVKQLVNNVSVVGRHSLSDLGARVL